MVHYYGEVLVAGTWSSCSHPQSRTFLHPSCSLAWEWCCSTALIHVTFGLPIGQPELDNSSLRQSSQVNLNCIKLTIYPAQMDSYKVWYQEDFCRIDCPVSCLPLKTWVRCVCWAKKHDWEAYRKLWSPITIVLWLYVWCSRLKPG